MSIYRSNEWNKVEAKELDFTEGKNKKHICWDQEENEGAEEVQNNLEIESLKSDEEADETFW